MTLVRSEIVSDAEMQKAIDVLVEVAEDQGAPPADRVRAAQTILAHAVEYVGPEPEECE